MLKDWFYARSVCVWLGLVHILISYWLKSSVKLMYEGAQWMWPCLCFTLETLAFVFACVMFVTSVSSSSVTRFLWCYASGSKAPSHVLLYKPAEQLQPCTVCTRPLSTSCIQHTLQTSMSALMFFSSGAIHVTVTVLEDWCPPPPPPHLACD